MQFPTPSTSHVSYDHVYEPSDDAYSPLAAEADYGWPVEEPEIAHTNGR